MIRFIKNIIVFVAIILLLALVADLMVSKGLRLTERGHFYTMNALMNKKLDADIVILGNSRAVGSYNPYIIDSVLGVNSRNLGVSAQPFGVSYLRWQLYHRNNVKPDLVIVNIDFRELRIVSNGFEKEQYYPYMTDSLVKPYLDLYGFSWAEKHIPMYRYRGDYKLITLGISELLHIHHDEKGDYYKGYSNVNTEWDGHNLRSILSKGRIKGQCDPKAVSLLERFLQETNDEGIPVIDKIRKETLSEAGFQIALSNFLFPLIDTLVHAPSIAYALQRAPELMSAILCHDGTLCHQPTAEQLHLPWRDIVSLCWNLN